MENAQVHTLKKHVLVHDGQSRIGADRFCFDEERAGGEGQMCIDAGQTTSASSSATFAYALFVETLALEPTDDVRDSRDVVMVVFVVVAAFGKSSAASSSSVMLTMP